MTHLEITLAIAFGIQFLASVSLALAVRKHEMKLNILKDVINEIGHYLAAQMMAEREAENENTKAYKKSKSKVS